MIGQPLLENLLIIPAFPFVLGIVVFFHELGHFWVARRCGVKIDAFSIGFGPELFAVTDRHGTRWRLAVIPLGGYVKFAGDLNGASVPDEAALAAMPPEVRRTSFYAQSVGKRAAIVAAGPAASLLLAVVIFAASFFFMGIHTLTPIVGGVQPGTPAMAAGFKAGDLITSIDGHAIADFSDIKAIVTLSANDMLTVDVLRDGKSQVLQVTPRRQSEDTLLGKAQVAQIGIKPSSNAADRRTEYPSPVRAVSEGVAQTWQIIHGSVTMLTRLVTGRESADQLSGPIGIARGAGKIASISFFGLLFFAGFLSASIGFANLFPIPLLDGGHLMYFFFEAVRRRPLSVRTQELGFRVGLALVVLLMVFAASNDILRPFRQ